MKARPDYFNPVYLLLQSNYSPEQSISLLLDAIDQEISLMAHDDSQLFISSQSRLQFLLSREKITSGLFSKISESRSDQFEITSELKFKKLLAVWIELIATSTDQTIPDDLLAHVVADEIFKQQEVKDLNIFIPSSRISILRVNKESQQCEFVFESSEGGIQFFNLNDLKDKNRKLFLQCLKYLNPPFDMYAHAMYGNEKQWKFDQFVILPDFLVDVTSVASCYNHQGSNPLKHLLHLFFYRPTGYHTLVGTAVNQFLDELILNPDLNFEKISQNIFQHNPLAFSLLQDTEVHKYYEAIQAHYQNIHALVNNRFNKLVTTLEDCLMEPSFYSVEYGIQGRLDVFYQDKKSQQLLIIELKSGKPYLTNTYGINADHHAQIMLYYLLIQSVFGKMQPVQGMILYSSQSLNPLRAAPLLDELRNDLIHLRNSIILLHLHLAFRTPEDVFILDLIQESGFQSTETYAKRDAMQMWQIYSSLSAIEKNYFKELSGFIAREQIISKMGRSDSQYTEGMASLWLLSESEKRHHFMILHDLKIKEIIHQTGEFPILILTQNIGEENISNFRKGDTLVLYPGHSALNEQIYKCTLVEHHPNEYHIRLRTRQFPDAEQSKIKKWNLEHDYIDRSFQYHFQGLLEFSQSEPEQRELIMGLRAPQKKQELSFVELKDVPEMIAPVIEKMISSKDYFLLWGPPGSGKTSLVIRYLSKVLNSETNEHILLLAYTNRAVDEMCEALEAEDLNYIRIGSRFAIQDKFRKNLLEEKINGLKNRKQLIQLFNNTRIFTATIASIQGKKELFLLKKFDTVIIDEASQILESQLTGLLTKFNRFMLIGDHMQLPAVSTQSESECAYKSPQLLDAGYKNMSTSLFERLLQQCKNNSWDHAYSMLTHQGRMHQDVMNFPGRVFYNNQLQILPDRDYQKADYAKSFIFESQISQHPLANNRTLFVSSSTQEVQFPSKTNPTEARIISKLVKDLYELHQKHQLKWHELNLGIITPFRAQIAQIRMELDREGLTAIPLSVDTAERYQGSTRNIIILSTVISDVSQLPQISSINEQGIDRKLNVALTRAREQVILVGNREVLSTSPLYKALLDEYQELQPW